VEWADGHDSIMPYVHLRAHCPCEKCLERRGHGELPGAPGVQLRSIEVIADTSVFLGWTDDHETIYLLPELRGLCRCAYCIGEPERPITG
jgi:DUF971 family protein